MKLEPLIKRIQEIKIDKQKIILIAVATLVFVYLDFFFVIGMQSRSLKQINQKISKLNNDIKATKRELIRMQQLAGEARPAKAITKEFISAEEIPMLLSEISNIANKARIKIIQIEPTKNPKTAVRAGSAENLLPIAIDLELKGGYHALGEFLGDLENSTKFITVAEVKIVSQGDDYNKQNISLRLITYVSG